MIRGIRQDFLSVLVVVMSLSSVLPAEPDQVVELRRAINVYAEEYFKEECNTVGITLPALEKAYASLVTLEAHPETDLKTKEKTLCNMVTLACGMKNYADAIKDGKRFLKTYKASRYRQRVRRAMADSHFELGEKDEALKLYQTLLISYGSIPQIGLTLIRCVEILEGKGEKYLAYSAGASYVQMCEKSYNKALKDGEMSVNEAKLWRAIQAKVKALGNEPEVKKGIELAERERRKREGIEGQ